jgi:hypothetical protein
VQCIIEAALPGHCKDASTSHDIAPGSRSVTATCPANGAFPAVSIGKLREKEGWRGKGEGRRSERVFIKTTC